MRRSVRVAAAAILPLAILAGTGGCASGRTAVRKDAQGISVRLPPAEALEFGVRSEREAVPPAFPLSVADEYRDRWLTLFEVTFSPVEASGLPEGEADAP
jgi:hypothetical protein